ncbi:MAG: LptF/LptG family permease [Candidatus Omnitrophica bacterium]|nr:LptF/LptG family permease [Candidatus Omnitrophota bacterium]
MKIVRNYLLKELCGPFILSLVISTFILTASNLIQMADMIVNKGVGFFQMVLLLTYLMPSLLMFTIPISVLSAVLLGFARLTSDNEIIALRASGVSLLRLSVPIFVVGIIISLACIPLNYNIMPKASFNARKLVKDIGIKNPTALLEPGVFVKVFQDYIIFVYDIKGNELKNVRIYQPQDNGPTRTVIAQTGTILPQRSNESIKIKLSNGIADETDPENPDNFYKLVFKNYYMTLNLQDSFKKQETEKKPRELTLRELNSEIQNFKEKNIDTMPLQIEIQNKISFAFSNLIFILIAIPIGVRTHRREKSVNFGMALVVFLIYWGLMLGGVALVMKKLLPVWLGIWGPNILFVFFSILLFIKGSKR